MALRIDRLGVVVAAVAAYAMLAPFATFRANRIVRGVGQSVFEALPGPLAATLVAVVVAGIAVALLRTPGWARLVASLVVLAALAIAIGFAPGHLTAEGDRLARVSPASGFWLAVFAFALLAADAVARLRLSPLARVAVLVAVAAAFGLILGSGLWDGLSILKEYASRADAFWREGARHLTLAFGSLANGLPSVIT